MKLIIQHIRKVKLLLLCLFLLITFILSPITSLKYNSNEDNLSKYNPEAIESNRKLNNQTNKIKKANFNINFKLANVSLVFPHPIEQEFRLNFDDKNEENRKSINPLKFSSSNIIDKDEKSNKNFLAKTEKDSINEGNDIKDNNKRITLSEKTENTKCNHISFNILLIKKLFVIFFFNNFI